ncbi:hypothetical protein GJAV_G00104780 [Gymnothorax javanicus]|nr:hypothetical protein GJAV_G00104780 [Gymnothorax javanicus]
MDVSTVSTLGPAAKVASMASLLCATSACGVAPMWAVKRTGKCIADPELNFLSSFSAGVFLSSCLLDLLPDSLQSVTEVFHCLDIKLQFPLPEFLLSMGFFLVLLTEQIILAYKGQSGPTKEKGWALLMDPSIQSQREENQAQSFINKPNAEGSESAHLQVEPACRLAVCSSALILSLSLNAALEGLAIGVWRDGRWATGVYISLLLRRCLVAPGLTLALGRMQLRFGVIGGILLLFALASPVTVALTEAAGPLTVHCHRLTQSALGALATGASIYVTCLDILPYQLRAPQGHLPRLALVLSGFALYTGTLFFKI